MHKHTHTHLLFSCCWFASGPRLCRSILITKRKVSASSLVHHSANDKERGEVGREVQCEGKGEVERSDSSLWGAISIKAALSPTACHCWCELKESVYQLSLLCVRLPFSELWRRGEKEEQAGLCAGVQNTKRNNTRTITQREEKQHGTEKSPICFYMRLCNLCCYQNFRRHWFFSGTEYREPYFSTLPFQVFTWRAGIENLPLPRYF